jgi:cytochrome b subunit of formate dehydrogenase
MAEKEIKTEVKEIVEPEVDEVIVEERPEERLEYVTVPDEDYIIAHRYTAIQRAQHWVNAFAMGIFFITGLMIFLGDYPLLGYKNTQTYHLYLGIFIMFWSLVLYFNIVVAEKKIRDIIPTPRDFLDLFIIVLCCLGIWSDDKYPHYDYYDPEKKKYVMKYHPTQKLLALTNIFMLILIGATGFVMYDELVPGDFELLAVVSAVLVDPLVDITNTNARFIHFVVFVYFLASTMIHTYFTLLKDNRGRFEGMVRGEEKIPIHESSG